MSILSIFIPFFNGKKPFYLKVFLFHSFYFLTKVKRYEKTPQQATGLCILGFVSELVNLSRKENVTLSERKGELDFIGKGNKRRVVPIPSEARTKLMDYLKERTDQEEALFVSNNGKRITVRNVQIMIARIGEECGFTGDESLHPHIFRHTWCYDSVKRLPLSTVTHLAGHSDPKTTLIYTKPNMDDVREKLDNLYEE